jgi:hypothetical protein
MILTALVAAILMSSSVEDYFPLVPGTRWTYQDDDGREMTQEIGQPIDIGKGIMATPRTTSAAGESGNAELYRTDGDNLLLVGFYDKRSKLSPLTLINPTQIVFRAGSSKVEWKYTSELPTGLGPVLVQVHGDSTKGPRRKVVDRDVETLIVHVVSQIGNEKPGVEVRQDVVYGKGIGMIEVTETRKAQGETVKKVLKLVKFEPSQG